MVYSDVDNACFDHERKMKNTMDKEEWQIE